MQRGWPLAKDAQGEHQTPARAADMAVVIGRNAAKGALQRVLSPLVLEEAPPAFVEPCVTSRHDLARTSRRPAHERGVALAHRAVWEEARRRGCRKLFVFEADVLPAALSSAATAVAKARLDDTDLVYLGWCYGEWAPPLSTHAYVLSARALNALLEAVPPAGCDADGGPLLPLDHLVRRTVLRRGLSWRLADDVNVEPLHWTRGPFRQRSAEDPES